MAKKGGSPLDTFPEVFWKAVEAAEKDEDYILSFPEKNAAINARHRFHYFRKALIVENYPNARKLTNFSLSVREQDGRWIVYFANYASVFELTKGLDNIVTLKTGIEKPRAELQEDAGEKLIKEMYMKEKSKPKTWTEVEKEADRIAMEEARKRNLSLKGNIKPVPGEPGKWWKSFYTDGRSGREGTWKEVKGSIIEGEFIPDITPEEITETLKESDAAKESRILIQQAQQEDAAREETAKRNCMEGRHEWNSALGRCFHCDEPEPGGIAPEQDA